MQSRSNASIRSGTIIAFSARAEAVRWLIQAALDKKLLPKGK